MWRLSTQDKNHMQALFLPSWVSGLIAVVVGLSLTIGVIFVFSLNNSDIQQQLIAWQQSQPEKPLTTPDQIVEASDKPTLQGSWPLIVVWSFVGLITYMVAAGIMHSVSETLALRKSLNYVHVKRKSVLEIAAGRLALRGIATLVLAGLISLFLTQAVPYGISASHASAADIVSIEGALYALLSFTVVTLSMHVMVIFMRLTLGKVRIFSDY
jgi:hypothetical protein